MGCGDLAGVTDANTILVVGCYGGGLCRGCGGAVAGTAMFVVVCY